MNNQPKRKLRIKSLKRDALPNLWKDIPNQDFSEMVLKSTPREISILFGCMSSSSINNTFNFLQQDVIHHVFNELSANTVNKIITACNEKNIKKIALSIDPETIEITLNKCNQHAKERLIKVIPEHERIEYTQNIGSNSRVTSLDDYYTSNAFDSVLRNSIIERIKDLEDREGILEKNYKQKESAFNERLEQSTLKLSALDEQIRLKQEEIAAKESEFISRQADLKIKINNLEKEHSDLQQARLEIKFPEYVDSAVNGLKTKGEHFDNKAFWWNIQGGVALALAIISAILAFLYGGYQFNHAAKENIDWFFFLFLLVKGLIVVTLFVAWAKHAFNVANAYVHEALKRSDRMHAINFGKFYLEIYGNKVDQKEMKDIFENWNISSDSAFTKIKEPDFSVKQLEQVATIIESVRKIKSPDLK